MDTGRADMGNQQGNRQGWYGRPGKVTGEAWQSDRETDKTTGEPTGRQGRRQGDRGGLAKWGFDRDKGTPQN